MLRLFGLDSRGHRTSIEDSMSWSQGSFLDPPSKIDRTLASTISCSQPSLLLKRRRMSHDDLPSSEPAIKRAKTTKGESPPKSAQSLKKSSSSSSKECSVPAACDMDKVRATIQHQFGVEILYKHNELRLINQELAKCQIALEQLRRCHLVPYPVNCPTPEQMLDICNGQGPAVTLLGDAVPHWSPPFGVTDGPYARHFAKWLIPDPVFDQSEPKAKLVPSLRARGFGPVPEGRTTRNSSMDMGYSVRGRHGRSSSGQKHHHQHQALPQSNSTVKDKVGPCILKRALDGQTVRLACLDCFRDDFSSTQGFINHCRISHKRDFKSHEQAAIACGHPIDSVIGGDGTKDEKPTALLTTTTQPILHPFTRQDMTDQEAYIALRSRIFDSLELYKQGKLPGVTSIPSSNQATHSGDTPAGFEPSQDTPYLSQLMRRRKFQGSLKDFVANAKIKISWDDLSSGDDAESPLSSLYDANDLAVQTSVMMRMPARSIQLPGATNSAGRPTSSKGRAVHKSTISAQKASMSLMSKRKSSGALSDGELDLEDANLSPNGVVSNNAPSLVSDDGEYDSDEGSSVSEDSDSLEDDAVSDVAEISLDDEHDSRALRRGSGSIGSPMKLRKDDSRVAFIGSVRGTAGERRAGKF